MSGLDWLVLTITLLGIIAYGLYRSRTTQNLEGYFLCNNTMPWYLVLLSIMGTQASAVTFLAPGQSYTDGMRFVQLYFGTDQSQVGRYLTAKSVGESRLGLLMNGLVKIPMQFLILLLGVMVFSFYQYHREPVFFNQ